MKRTSILVAAALLFASAFAIAEEAVLVDFALLNADIIAGKDGEMTQNRKTIMDYSTVAGSSYTDEQKALMRTSLAIGQWEVVLNSSSRSAANVAVSHAVEAKVSDEAKNFAGQTLMGVRIEFPLWHHNAHASIKPTFEIPIYAPMAEVNEEGVLEEPTEEDIASGKTRFEDGYGVIHNVGVIKSIAVNTYGMNFPHGLYVLIRNAKNEVKRYFMGYLLFDGWKELVWNNPSYLTDVRARETRVYPVYPVSLPSAAFAGFLVTRDAANAGGPFIGYFKDVKIIYDKAVLSTVRDFADENIWGIQTKRNEEHQKIELSRFGHTQVNRFLEKEKMATELGFTVSEGAENAEASEDGSSAEPAAE